MDRRRLGQIWVWDLPLRLFHWLLVLSLCGSWATAELGFDWTDTHFLLGYCSLGLIAFRILWGVFGTHHARFTSFVTSPAAAIAQIPQLFSRTPGQTTGHTAIGGWSIVLMLALITVQAVTGLFISDDIFWAGPYNAVVSKSTAGLLANIHHTNFILLQIVIAAHIGAVTWYHFGKRTNLTKAMITGWRQSDQPANNSAEVQPGSSHLWIAGGIALIVSGLVWSLVYFAPPPVVEDFF